METSGVIFYSCKALQLAGEEVSTAAEAREVRSLEEAIAPKPKRISLRLVPLRSISQNRKDITITMHHYITRAYY